MPGLELYRYEVVPDELADWLDRQGPDRWWLVDGDPFLQSRLSMPCPGSRLAAELRRVGRPLVVIAEAPLPDLPEGKASAAELDRFAYRAEGHTDREFHMAWKKEPGTWWLVEDTEMAREALAEGAD